MTFEKEFTISVSNVNEAPTDIALSSSTVAENQASGTTVGTLSATDPDAADTHSFSLVGGTGDSDNGSFAIVGSSLQTSAVFNFEAKNSYSIRVRATDNGLLTFEKEFTISVSNVNEAPTDIALSSASVAENQASGTTVGTLSAIDPEAGDTHSFSLVAGTGSTDNGSFTIVGSSLQTAAAFDFEAKSSYSIRVRATDNGLLTFEKVFTITVTNANEEPTDIALSSSTVAENQASGTTVGTLSTTDPDAGDTHTYTLVAGTGSTDNGSFTIVGTSLQTSAVFDFEAKSSYSIRVRSTDSGALTLREGVHHHGQQRQRGPDRHCAVEQQRRGEPGVRDDGRHAFGHRPRRGRHAQLQPRRPARARPTTARSRSSATACARAPSSTSRRRTATRSACARPTTAC